MVEDFENKYEGETCLIIGNGRSLDKMPLFEFTGKYKSFGANKIYGLPVTIDFWTCVDRDMLHDCVPWMLNAGSAYPAEKFVPRDIPLPGSHGLNVVIASGFSRDPSDNVVLGGTVTYVNMQLAFYMGFTTVLLVGLDHKYPKTAVDGRPGSKFIASGEDPDHFEMADGSPYFSPGKIYNRPELDAVGKYTYPSARRVFENDGRRIINLTPETATDAFPKESWKNWL